MKIERRLREGNYKIFEIGMKRAMFVLSTIETLREYGMCSFKEARKYGITNSEWLKAEPIRHVSEVMEFLRENI